MEIIIQGTKGGYKILFETSKVPSSVAKDVRPITNNESPVGKSAYSIAFAANGYVFTKYVIVRDMMRSMSVGNIAFSIYNTHNKKLSGNDVRELLNQLSDDYCKEYIVNNNLGDVREDWSFINAAISKYESKLEIVSSRYTDIYQAGTADAAFHYYSSNDELEKFLDAPYQREYCKYKQVFFVNKELEGKSENPLNALRHDPTSDLTGKINFDNPEYTLVWNRAIIDVLVNGNIRINYESKVRRNDELEIKYKKPYYEPESYEGRLSELNYDFVEVNDDAKTITIKEKKLFPKPIDIEFLVLDGDGDTVSGAEITCRRMLNHQELKLSEGKISQNKITFYGEARNDRWYITAKKNNLSYESEGFKPGYENIIVKLILEEQYYSQDQIKYKSKLPTQQKLKGTNKKKLFRWWLIAIYIVAIIGIIVVINDYSNRSNHDNESDETTSFMQYVEGTELNLYKLNELKNKYCIHPNEQPKDNESSWLQQLFGSNSANEPKAIYIPDYCSKIENAIAIRNLINSGSIDSLKDLHYSKEQNPFINAVNEIDDRFKDKIGNTMKGYNQIDGINLGAISNFINNLQKLLIIREEVKTLTKIEELNTKSDKLNQIRFPSGITTVVDTIKENIIIEIDHRTDKIKLRPQEQLKKESKTNEHKQNGSNLLLSQEDLNIIQYLKSNDLELSKLSEYKRQTSNEELQASIDLCIKFWEIVKSKGDITFWNFRDIIKKDSNLKTSSLKEFLDEICEVYSKNKDLFNRFLRGNARKNTLEELKQKIQKDKKESH